MREVKVEIASLRREARAQEGEGGHGNGGKRFDDIRSLQQTEANETPGAATRIEVEERARVPTGWSVLDQQSKNSIEPLSDKIRRPRCSQASPDVTAALHAKIMSLSPSTFRDTSLFDYFRQDEHAGAHTSSSTPPHTTQAQATNFWT